MVKPVVNQVERMSRECRNSRMRGAARAPNSPRDSAVGVVRPRAMKPDMVSKSKVRQTIWRGTAESPKCVSIRLKVIRGLDLRIHPRFTRSAFFSLMDRRVKPGDDGIGRKYSKSAFWKIIWTNALAHHRNHRTWRNWPHRLHAAFEECA